MTKPLRRIAICLAGLLLFAPTFKVTAQAPPVGTWDFVLSGLKHGVAQITFVEDGTLNGIAVFTFFGPGGPGDNVFGGANLDGNWAYDGTNKIRGFINEVAYTGGQTNLTTNGMSFRAVAKPLKVNLFAFGDHPGKVIFKGIPLQATNDVSGSYHGTGRKPGERFPFAELFSLKSVGTNHYDVTGEGPAYDYTGTFLVSRQRYAAFYQTRGDVGSNLVITAYAGRFNLTTRSGLLKGTDGVTTNMKLSISPVVP